MTQPIFISYSRENDDIVTKLRETLALHGQIPWVDSHQMTGGDKLTDTIKHAIADASHFLVVVSLETLSSEWVPQEIAIALKHASKINKPKVIPVVLPGIKQAHLKLLGLDKLVHIAVADATTGLDDAMSEIFAALGLQLPQDWNSSETITAQPIEELTLKLTDPQIELQDGIRRVKAMAELSYHPANSNKVITSNRYTFTAPFGALALEEIRWYIENFHRWPTGVFKDRADKTEQDLLLWGKQLYDAAFHGKSALEGLNTWRKTGIDLRFSVQVDFDPPEGTDKDKIPLYREAASDLLALPWEIIHDGIGHLSQGAIPVQIRRRLPKRKATISTAAKLPIRVLLLSPRPEVTEDGQDVGYLDHRASALPLMQAMDNLGQSLVKVDMLNCRCSVCHLRYGHWLIDWRFFMGVDTCLLCVRSWKVNRRIPPQWLKCW